MLPLIYTKSATAITFLITCLIWMVPEIIGTFRQAAKRARTETAIRDRGSMIVLIGLQWLGLGLNFLFAWLFPAAAIPWLRMTLFSVGIAAILLGVALRWYAMKILGHYVTRDIAVADQQPVIQKGPYRAIRHPAYTGTFVTMLGVGLAVTNWASLAVLHIGVVIGHIYRVHSEEGALIERLGQPYLAYMQRTKRFIPWVC